MCNTTPADNPTQCRACGVLILDSFDDVCEDCATEMAQYYDSRDEAKDSDWYYIEQEDLAADWQMTTDELVDRIIATGESEEEWEVQDGPQPH